MRRSITATFVALVTLASLALPVQAGLIFTTFDFPGGPPSTANGINNNGAIVGFSGVSPTPNYILNPNGSFTSLNIGGDPAAMANGINNANTVVGVSMNTAFSLASGSSTPTFLPAPSPGNTSSSVAFGINDKGVIVGQYVNSSTGATPGFIYNNGSYTILNPTDPVSHQAATVTNAQSINNQGVGVGFESSNGVNQHGFMFNLAGVTTSLPDLSTALTASNGLVLTQFLGVNDYNEAVGYYQTTSGSQHGFIFNLSTDAYTYVDDPNAVPGVTGASITQITGINDSGVITGFYLDSNGDMHGFSAAAVPEPGPLVLFSVAGSPACCAAMLGDCAGIRACRLF